MGETGTLIIKGFNPTNPHRGDAIVATFSWVGSTNIIDSVVDVLTSSPTYTPVGNRYTLVDYVTSGGLLDGYVCRDERAGFPLIPTPILSRPTFLPWGRTCHARQLKARSTLSPGPA